MVQTHVHRKKWGKNAFKRNWNWHQL